jgi:hypothetical protein
MLLKATVSLNNIDVAGLRTPRFGVPPKANGSLSGQTQIESQSGKLSGRDSSMFRMPALAASMSAIP